MDRSIAEIREEIRVMNENAIKFARISRTCSLVVAVFIVLVTLVLAIA